MGNIAKWIEEIAGSEPVECAVIGKHDSRRYSEEPHPHPVGKIMSWADARAVLDYEYDDGFGSADCHPVFAWTATKIITITEYDGATSATWFPRNPVDIVPGFAGVDLYA